MAGAGTKTRAVAAEVIDAVVMGGQSLDAAVQARESALPARDRPLLRTLAYGVLRNHWQLQAWIDALVSRPFRRRDSVVNALLATGLYQLTDTRVPDHAAVSETVDATRMLRRPKLAGLVNACLRRFQRDGLAALAPATEEARWNHPRWLIEHLRADWPNDADVILEANNVQAPMWLRANASRLDAAACRKRLAEAGIDAELLDGVPDALRLAEARPVDELPGFADGDVSVQDAAAQIAARWLMNHEPQQRGPSRTRAREPRAAWFRCDDSGRRRIESTRVVEWRAVRRDLAGRSLFGNRRHSAPSRHQAAATGQRHRRSEPPAGEHYRGSVAHADPRWPAVVRHVLGARGRERHRRAAVPRNPPRCDGGYRVAK